MSTHPAQLFDRPLLRARRAKAAPLFHTVNFLKKEASIRLVENLELVTRQFPLAIELGAGQGELAEQLKPLQEIRSPKIARLVQTDHCAAMLAATQGEKLICDEEWLPFSPECAELVLSNWHLHWVNDIPGCLAQIQRILKPDGLFLAILPGAQTLKELRHIWDEVSLERQGGISPHISPFIEVRDGGNLLQRAGFNVPVADSEMLTVTYDNPLKLMQELRLMGEANALCKRYPYFTRRDIVMEVASRYQAHYGLPDGRVPATIELVTLTGWKPHPSQQKAAKRGSASLSLAAALTVQKPH